MNSRQGGEQPRIVVGVDGFESSKAALRWAIRQARLTGAVVEAVTAWHIPAGTGWMPTADMPDYQEDAFAVLAEAIDEMCTVDPDVQVCPRVVEGRAGQVLVDAADGADLLVVGSRVTAGWPRRCSARSASTACTTQPARSSSCAASTRAESLRSRYEKLRYRQASRRGVFLLVPLTSSEGLSQTIIRRPQSNREFPVHDLSVAPAGGHW